MLRSETDPVDPTMRKLLNEMVEDQSSEGGVIIGFAMGHAHVQGKDWCIAPPGTEVGLVYPQAGDKPKASYDRLPVIGYFKSGMSEYDSHHVYMPLEQMQKMRLLDGHVNQIQVKARAGVDLDVLAAKIEVALERLKPRYFSVATWEQKQGPLLAAVAVEQSILNLLLFFIIAVAGFGILAIFFMIVVEKTRDIGVLKALGASTSGVRGFFLGYGLSLGMVGSGVGMISGLLFVRFINEIEHGLSVVTGRRVFDRRRSITSTRSRPSSCPPRSPGSSAGPCSSRPPRASGPPSAPPSSGPIRLCGSSKRPHFWLLSVGQETVAVDRKPFPRLGRASPALRVKQEARDGDPLIGERSGEGLSQGPGCGPGAPRG